jgi:hypothetical protein
MSATTADRSGAKEGQGAVRSMICAAGVPAVEMACRVDLGTSVLEGREGSNILANWAIDIGGAVGGGSGNKAVEVEDILGTIACGRGSSSAVASALGRWRWRLAELLPPPLPLPALQVSLARDAMARLSSSLSLLLLVGVTTLILTSLNFLVLVLQ